MMDINSNFGGLLASARRALDTSISMLKNRVELATIELKEEKSRLTSVAIWGGVFVFSSFMAVIAITCTTLFVFWEQRVWVAVGLLAFCLIFTVAAILILRGRLKSPMPFAETIAQLKKDRAWLQGRN
jgi:uncharacterized membrane protein YqjE